MRMDATINGAGINGAAINGAGIKGAVNKGPMTQGAVVVHRLRGIATESLSKESNK